MSKYDTVCAAKGRNAENIRDSTIFLDSVFPKPIKRREKEEKVKQAQGG